MASLLGLFLSLLVAVVCLVFERRELRRTNGELRVRLLLAEATLIEVRDKLEEEALTPKEIAFNRAIRAGEVTG
jgi:hypothetical protein